MTLAEGRARCGSKSSPDPCQSAFIRGLMFCFTDSPFEGPNGIKPPALPEVLTLGSAAIILGHNHPSGDPTPSHEDARMTERISKAWEIPGIKLLDHVIIGFLSSFSFRNAGRLP